jgi:hypothetical protein
MMAGIPLYLFTAAKISKKGLLRKIIREDLEMTLGDFVEMYEKYKGH